MALHPWAVKKDSTIRVQWKERGKSMYGRLSGILCAVLVLTAGLTGAEVPQVINYQGKVTDTSGNPVSDGSYTMRFRIYNVSSGGTALWDSGDRLVSLAGGVFNVLLGESPQPAITLNFDVDYWLSVTFAGDAQTPRKRLGSVGYAYMASGLVPGTDVSGAVVTGTCAAIRATNTAATGYTFGVYGENYSTQGIGVYGKAAASTGTTYGICGQTYSTSGFGVYGYAAATIGDTYGGRFVSASTSGRGVFGHASAGTGTAYGVHGVAFSTSGRGVYGEATATTGITYGVYGQSASPSGRGVHGHATATTGYAYGGRFESSSSGGIGVYGGATATTGTTYGVYGNVSSADGYGGYFLGRGYFSDNVGIRTTSPDCALEVYGNGSDWTRGFIMLKNVNQDAGIRLYDSDTGVKHHIFNDNAGGDRLRLAPEGNYTSGITILQNGKVGVNTLSPGTPFSVYGLPGTSSYVPVRVNTITGDFYYQSASLRYKDEVERLETDFERILAVEPKRFVDRTSGERNIGYIAEEFVDLGLENLVIYRDGEPDGLKYELVPLYLLEIVKEQRKQIESIIARLAELEAQGR